MNNSPTFSARRDARAVVVGLDPTPEAEALLGDLPTWANSDGAAATSLVYAALRSFEDSGTRQQRLGRKLTQHGVRPWLLDDGEAARPLWGVDGSLKELGHMYDAGFRFSGDQRAFSAALLGVWNNFLGNSVAVGLVGRFDDGVGAGDWSSFDRPGVLDVVDRAAIADVAVGALVFDGPGGDGRSYWVLAPPPYASRLEAARVSTAPEDRVLRALAASLDALDGRISWHDLQWSAPAGARVQTADFAHCQLQSLPVLAGGQWQDGQSDGPEAEVAAACPLVLTPASGPPRTAWAHMITAGIPLCITRGLACASDSDCCNPGSGDGSDHAVCQPVVGTRTRACAAPGSPASPSEVVQLSELIAAVATLTQPSSMSAPPPPSPPPSSGPVPSGPILDAGAPEGGSPDGGAPAPTPSPSPAPGGGVPDGGADGGLTGAGCSSGGSATIVRCVRAGGL